MIWFPPEDRVGPIQLFEQEESGHLVRQGHRGKPDACLTSVEHCVIQAERAADDQGDVTRGLAPFLEALGKRLAGLSGPQSREGEQPCSLRYRPEQRPAFDVSRASRVVFLVLSNYDAALDAS